GDAIAGLEARDAVADADDDADAVGDRDARRERLPGGGAVDDEEVTVVEGGGGDLDEDLAGGGRGHGAVYELQGVDAVAAGDEGFHWVAPVGGEREVGRMLCHHRHRGSSARNGLTVA